MIKIQKYNEVEEDFFKGRPFDGDDKVVTSVLEEVQKRGDAALRLYGNKFDVAVPAVFEVPQEELKAAAEKLRMEKCIRRAEVSIRADLLEIVKNIGENIPTARRFKNE